MKIMLPLEDLEITDDDRHTVLTLRRATLIAEGQKPGIVAMNVSGAYAKHKDEIKLITKCILYKMVCSI